MHCGWPTGARILIAVNPDRQESDLTLISQRCAAGAVARQRRTTGRIAERGSGAAKRPNLLCHSTCGGTLW